MANSNLAWKRQPADRNRARSIEVEFCLALSIDDEKKIDRILRSNLINLVDVDVGAYVFSYVVGELFDTNRAKSLLDNVDLNVSKLRGDWRELNGLLILILHTFGEKRPDVLLDADHHLLRTHTCGVQGFNRPAVVSADCNLCTDYQKHVTTMLGVIRFVVDTCKPYPLTLVKAICPKRGHHDLAIPAHADVQLSPIVYACREGLDELVLLLLDSITVETEEHFDDYRYEAWRRYNPFFHVKRLRPETLVWMIQGIPCSKLLISHLTIRDLEQQPLGTLLSWKKENDVEIIRVLVIHGDLDIDTPMLRGSTLLHRAVWVQNVEMVEALLRLGCDTGCYDESGQTPLTLALKTSGEDNVWKEKQRKVIELLLAFGVDLKKERILYTNEEVLAEGIKMDSRQMNDSSDLLDLEQVRELRRSDRMTTLKRLCRKSIREAFKPRSDEVIRNLDCIPWRLKEFLLVENEPRILRCS